MTDIATTDSGALADRLRYAQALAASSLLPTAYRRQPANVLVAMEYGKSLGLDPVTAMQMVHVVEGKPTASAQLIGALVRRAGHRLRVTGDAQHAVAEVVRRDDPDFIFRAEWTIDRARAAGLAGKGPWKTYPEAMLKARAITEVARDACPEALSGVAYTAEELGAPDSSASGPAGPLAPQAALSAPPALVIEEAAAITKAQMVALADVLTQTGVAHRDERLQLIENILGRSVEQASNLTEVEAELVIELLRRLVELYKPAETESPFETACAAIDELLDEAR